MLRLLGFLRFEHERITRRNNIRQIVGKRRLIRRFNINPAVFKGICLVELRGIFIGKPLFYSLSLERHACINRILYAPIYADHLRICAKGMVRIVIRIVNQEFALPALNRTIRKDIDAVS